MLEDGNLLVGISKKIDMLHDKISSLEKQVAVNETRLNISAGFFGALSGMIIAVLVGILINFFSTKINRQDAKVILNKDNRSLVVYKQND